jgi:hypothetical protein
MKYRIVQIIHLAKILIIKYFRSGEIGMVVASYYGPELYTNPHTVCSLCKCFTKMALHLLAVV